MTVNKATHKRVSQNIVLSEKESVIYNIMKKINGDCAAIAIVDQSKGQLTINSVYKKLEAMVRKEVVKKKEVFLGVTKIKRVFYSLVPKVKVTLTDR